jgi:hypothetical protein
VRFAADRRTEKFKERFRDAVGGTPEDEYLAKVEQRRAAKGEHHEAKR